MCFRLNLSKSQQRPVQPSQDVHEHIKDASPKQYRYKARGTRTKALVDKPKRLTH